MLLRSQLLMKLLLKAYIQVPAGVNTKDVHVKLVLPAGKHPGASKE